MREEEERIFVKTYQGVAHGRANFGTGRAIFLWVLLFGLGTVWHGRATLGTGRANLLDLRGSIFFCFFESFLDNYLQNSWKQQKTNKI